MFFQEQAGLGKAESFFLPSSGPFFTNQLYKKLKNNRTALLRNLAQNLSQCLNSTLSVVL